MNDAIETFVRIEAIFNEALDVPAEARDSLVTERCGGDTTLQAEVRALLRACEAEEQLTASRRRRSESEGDAAPERRRVGPYEIDRLLGRGGMGAVYLAHRADGQYDQRVAIKLIDLPLATDFFRERFKQERQILAGLQHPYIARLLDGGVTADGDLYLAMEYVDGTPIHRFCDARKLGARERLKLFISVCEAVQFAHQNLVVHRDLKPDNIFVAEDGTPRLLDFGTAKLTSPARDSMGAAQEGDLTRHGFQAYTPQYASPEQVFGNPITTASDTYSLGVLLYLLLTGSLPYEIKDLNQQELIRVICLDPPRRPTVASGTVSGSDRRLDGDLEAILLKALRKEPQERYRTAEQLAADIQDYLDGRPVAARRGTFRYRAGKFIRRNRLAIAAAAVLALTLAAGVAGVLWQWRVANEERRRAEARSADLRELSNSLLSELDEAIKDLPGSTGVQKLLVTRVLEHLDRMAADARGAQGDRQTQLDLVNAYVRLGNIQGNAYDQNLGDPAGGLASLGKALVIVEPLAEGSNDRDALHALATVEDARSEILWQTFHLPEAVEAMHQATRSFDALLTDPHTPAPLIGEAAAAYGALGDEYGAPGTQNMSNPTEALKAYQKAIDLDYRALSVDPSFLRSRRGLAIMGMKMGSVEMENDPAQALRDFQTALERADALPKSEQNTLTTVRLRGMLERKEANAMEEIGRYGDAMAIFDKEIAVSRKLVDADPLDERSLVDLDVVLDDEAGSYDDAATPALAAPSANPEAEQRRNLLAAKNLYAETISVLDRLLKLNPSNERWQIYRAYAQVKVGSAALELHQPGDWAALSKQGMERMKAASLKPEASAMALDDAGNSAVQVEPAELRDPALAVECAERGVALSHRKLASALQSLARAYRAAGLVEKARATAKEGLALLPATRAGEPKSRVRRLLEYELR
jgi:eukaryotic-like serine/threonine-protein kinase